MKRRAAFWPIALGVAALLFYSGVTLSRCAEITGENPPGSSGANPASVEYPEMFRVECVGRVTGCACQAKAPPAAGERRTVYHAAAAPALDTAPDAAARTPGYRHVALSGERRCYYPIKALRPMPYAKVPLSPLRKLDHSPLPLKKIAPAFDAAAADARNPKRRKSLGKYWATYYHLAVEDYHPGKRVPVLDRQGRKLGTASRAFLKQVTWQGSGIASNGLRLHYTGTQMRFNTYAKNMWGHGAGYGYRVFPYRTLALHFKGLCRRLMPGQKCSKRDVIGTLVYIQQVAERRIRMPDGSIHDGYFCATDTGSPNYIKDDRIDIFVGTHGGGNPYLPPARRPNALIEGGIENLVPSDWRLWRGKNDRVWCDPQRLPANPAQPGANDCTHDYHVVAAHKALELTAILDSRGRPLRCAKRP